MSIPAVRTMGMWKLLGKERLRLGKLQSRRLELGDIWVAIWENIMSVKQS